MGKGNRRRQKGAGFLLSADVRQSDPVTDQVINKGSNKGRNVSGHETDSEVDVPVK